MPDKKQKAKSKKKTAPGNEDRIDSVLDAGSSASKDSGKSKQVRTVHKNLTITGLHKKVSACYCFLKVLLPIAD